MMRAKIVTLLVILILFSSNCAASPYSDVSSLGTTYYLDGDHPEAEDSPNHGSIDQPWKTLRYAFRRLKPGDILLIREGVYQEERWLTLDEEHTAHEDAPIRVEAYPGETVVIQNSRPISFYGANWWTIKGLVFESPYESGHYFLLGLHEELGQERTVAAEHITIEGCEFRNGVNTVIYINYARNILIEKNYFHHVRPGRPYHEIGDEANAIGIPYVSANIVIKDNRFEDIGSDGVHLGAKGYLPGSDIRDVSIISNTFWINRPYDGILGNVGENGIDIKWAKGPVLISDNRIHGFRPTTPEQDASGSDGEGIIIHDNAQNIIIDDNYMFDNTRHVVVARGTDGESGETTNIDIQNNRLESARDTPTHDAVAILIRDVGVISIRGNRIFSADSAYILKADTGGKVVLRDNLIVGGLIGGSIDELVWEVYGNIWQDVSVPPLLQNKNNFQYFPIIFAIPL